MNAEQLDSYDAGLLNDFGGGNVGWWQDYIRAELERAHEHYKVQVAALFADKVLVPVELLEAVCDAFDDWELDCMELRAIIDKEPT